MSGKQIAAIVCFFVAAGLVVSGITSVARGPGVFHPSGLGVSHAVGAFLPALVAMGVGTWLYQKPKQR